LFSEKTNKKRGMKLNNRSWQFSQRFSISQVCDCIVQR